MSISSDSVSLVDWQSALQGEVAPVWGSVCSFLEPLLSLPEAVKKRRPSLNHLG